jgi:UDP-N-acetylglucosamine--N-acetylmuramyl-(pentapeptide) pyrophosphoryl-undecaprenol N-acetylglucosamine transferase
MESKKKILVTGGHVTPALAVIDRLTEKNYQGSLLFVGRKYNNEYERTESFEYHEIVRRGIPFINLEAGRVTRIFSLRTVINILKVPRGFIAAWHILQKEKPDVILSFGGYLALPIAYMAKLLGIMVYTHEQTIHPGLANRMIGSMSKTIFVSFPESMHFFKGKQTLHTGNPLRKSIFEVKKKFDIPKGYPVIYVTGGSLGAHAVNVHIEHILPALLETAVVIHQTGNVQEYADYARLSLLRTTFKPEMQERYILKEHVTDEEIGAIYKAADVVVGRSGANTFFELIALKKPAVLIPLPWAAHDEQRKQASLFVKHHAGFLFEQSGNSQELLTDILQILDHTAEFTARTKELSHYHKDHAADQIIDVILQN